MEKYEFRYLHHYKAYFLSDFTPTEYEHAEVNRGCFLTLYSILIYGGGYNCACFFYFQMKQNG